MSMIKTTTTTILDPFLKQYLEGRIEKNLSAKTIYNYRHTFTMFQTWCEGQGINPQNLTPEQAREWSLTIKQNYLPATHSRHVVNLTACYSDAHGRGKIKINPCYKLSDTVARQNDKEPRIYTPHECRMILGAVENELEERMVYGLLLTGARAFELRKLKWQKDTGDTYVDWENNQLVIVGKGGKLRYTPIHPILREKLDEWCLTATHPSVYVSDWNRTISDRTWQETLNAILRRAGVDAPDRPSHAFRRTLNTSLTRQGVRVDVIEKMFGWSAEDIRGKNYTGRVDDDGHKAIAMAYQDDPIFPEQSHLKPMKKIQKPEADELELLRLRLAVLEAENRNLELQKELTCTA